MEIAAKESLLVELDALLDTRLATLARIDQELAKKALEGRYLQRICDDFDALLGTTGITERYRELYAQRDRETLIDSRITGGVVLINELTRGWDELSRNSPFVEAVEIEINTYPYELTAAETEELVRAVMAYTVVNAEVKIGHYSPEELDPQTIRAKGWTTIMLYDFNSWLELHQERVRECRIPGVSFLTPALFQKLPSEEELERGQMEEFNPFQTIRVILAEFVGVFPVGVEYFSLVRP